jgi:hypothetical protein
MSAGSSILDEEMIVQGSFTEKIYPNPTKGISQLSVNITASGSAHLTIIDMYGKLVVSRYVFLNKGLQQQMIDLTPFANGSYDIVLRNGSIRKTFRLVKQ